MNRTDRKLVFLIVFTVIVIFFFLVLHTNNTDLRKNLSRAETNKQPSVVEINNLAVLYERNLKDIMNSLIPIVESVSDRNFINAPDISVVNIREMQKIISDNLQDTSFRLNRHKDRLPKQKDAFNIALYGDTDNEIFIIAENIQFFYKIQKIKDEDKIRVLKIFIIHELFHALQNQELVLGSYYRSFDSRTKFIAFKSLLEGHSNFMTELAAKKAGLSRYHELVNKANYSSPITLNTRFEEYVFRKEIIFDKVLLEKGTEFVRYHYITSGNEILWSILRNPPKTTYTILNPTKYDFSFVKDNKSDYHKLLENLSPLTKRQDAIDGKLLFTNAAVNHFDMYRRASLINQTDLDKVLPKVIHAQTLYIEFDNVNIGSISFYITEKYRYCENLFHVFNEMDRKYIEAVASYEEASIVNPLFKDCQFALLDVCKQISYKEQSKNGGELPVQKYRIAKNNILIEIEDFVLSLEKSELDEIFNFILSRFRQSGM